MKAYNELFLLPLPARYVRTRAEALLFQGGKAEGEGGAAAGGSVALRRRRARAMGLHYVAVCELVYI